MFTNRLNQVVGKKNVHIGVCTGTGLPSGRGGRSYQGGWGSLGCETGQVWMVGVLGVDGVDGMVSMVWVKFVSSSIF